MVIAMPAVFRGIGLDPLETSNSFYVLWLILGYLIVSSVLVVSLGRVGDIFGRVRMYTLGFACEGGAPRDCNCRYSPLCTLDVRASHGASVSQTCGSRK
jgi:MFS family permease